MSGIWGIALADPRMAARTSDVAPMGDEASPRSIHMVAAASAALAAQDFPHRKAGVAMGEAGGAPVGVAFHGSLFDTAWNVGSDPDGLAGALREGYLQHGLGLLDKLRGDFSIAIWDGRSASLHVASDRFRAHPLFYYVDREKLVFASRIRAILACPRGVSVDLDPGSLIEVLAASAIPTPATIYRQVRKLPPGTVLSYRGGELSTHSYWNMRFRSDRSPERVLRARLRERLDDALRVRLEGDSGQEIGCFLSGGIDSSTVAGLITKRRGRPVRTFSIGFGEPRFNEMDFARTAARAFSAEHHEYYVQPADVTRAIPILLDAYDEPFANASAVPTYYCARLAREHGVEILYAGDGGDELFAGNERYAVQRFFDQYRRIPAWIREPVLRPAMEALSRSGVPLFVKAAKYIRRARVPYPERLASYGFFRVVPIEQVVEDELLAHINRDVSHAALISRYYHEAEAEDDLDRQLYIDLKLAISDNDVPKVTRATEAAGISVRYPFLDHLLAEFAGTVPASLRMRGTQLRTFFKRAYSDLLPAETLAKKKHGFGLPIPIWLRTDPELHALMRDLVLGSESLSGAYIRRSARETLVERHASDQTSFYGTILWNVMVLELWLRRHRTAAHVS